MKPARLHVLAAAAALMALGPLGACSNGKPACSAPSSGSFTVTLGYSQTVPAAIYCDGATGDAESCVDAPHPFDGATWNVDVDGSSATVTSGDGAASWSCGVISPESSPSSGPDGGALPGSGCYLLVTCSQASAAASGPVDVEIQVLPQASDGASDLLALVHDASGYCCSDEYTGTWH